MEHIKKVIWVTLVSVILYCAWIAYSGYEDVLQGLQRVGWAGFGLLLFLSLVNYVFRFLRWHWMLADVTKQKIPLIDHLYCYLAGFALTATPGKVGEALRSYYLKPHGIKVSESLAALFAERLIDLISVLIIGSLALLQFEQYRWVAYFVICVVLLAAFIVRMPFVPRVIDRIANASGSPKIKHTLHGISATITSAGRFMSAKIWIVGLIIGVFAWGAEAWGFVLLVNWLTGNEWLYLGAGIYALSMIVGAISFLPGGLGGAEAVMAAALLAIGITLADATVATIICRVVTLWFAILIGLLVMIRLQSIHKYKPLKSTPNN